MSTLYHVAKPDGTKFGQMTADDISTKLSTGELTADCLIWTEGWADWRSVTTLSAPPVVPSNWGLMSALKSVYWHRYATFRGRASRAEYWWSTLGCILVAIAGIIATTILDALLGTPAIITCLFVVLAGLFSVIPGIALMVRRLHDIGLSGWFYLLSFIPYIGGIFLFVCTLIPSGAPNRHGAGPNGPAA